MATLLKGWEKRKACSAILQSLKQGSTLHAACAGVNIDPGTFWRWRKKSRILDAATQAVVSSRISIVEDALYKKAAEGNTTAMIFFLVNRAPDRWHDVGSKFQNNAYFVNNGKAGSNGSFDGADANLAAEIRARFESMLHK